MKNIGNIVPGVDENSKEKKLELEAVPIFRNNDLYAELFPEIKPTLEKGEKPTVKKILEEILKYRDKKVILDMTCADPLYYDATTPTLEDIPSELGLEKIPTNCFYMEPILKILKEKFGIIVPNPDEGGIRIEEKIEEILEVSFSPELVKELFEIAKQKNNNIKRVYILTEHINDHIPRKNKNGSDAWSTVLPILTNEAKKSFEMDPIILPTMSVSEIKDGDLIVVDRHNQLAQGSITKEKPDQFSLLPLASELANNKQKSAELIAFIRKGFEKHEETKES